MICLLPAIFSVIMYTYINRTTGAACPSYANMLTGVVQGLTDIGVFEHVSWNAGASGGGWYVLAHTLASLSNTQGMNSAESVFQDIRVRKS